MIHHTFIMINYVQQKLILYPIMLWVIGMKTSIQTLVYKPLTTISKKKTFLQDF